MLNEWSYICSTVSFSFLNLGKPWPQGHVRHLLLSPAATSGCLHGSEGGTRMSVKNESCRESQKVFTDGLVPCTAVFKDEEEYVRCIR